MAGYILEALSASAALAATTTKTVLQLKAAAQQVIKLKSWGVFFDSPSVAVTVRLLRQTTDGTRTTFTPVKVDPGRAETIQTTVGHIFTSTEPTDGDVFFTGFIYAGFKEFLPDREEYIFAGGTRIAITCNPGSAINGYAWMRFEE